MIRASSRGVLLTSFPQILPEQYRLGEQQDVAELGKHLLDLVERELGRDGVGFFGGKIRSTVKCSVCGTESERLEPFTDLPLPFPPNLEGTLTLEQMIKFAFRSETMTGDNQFRCSKCDKLVDATLSGAHGCCDATCCSLL